MKLNNKGFAITSVLYGLLILFVVLVGTYLTILSAQKNRVDTLVEGIEENYNEGNNYYTISFTYTKDDGTETIEKLKVNKDGSDIENNTVTITGTNETPIFDEPNFTCDNRTKEMLDVSVDREKDNLPQKVTFSVNSSAVLSSSDKCKFQFRKINVLIMEDGTEESRGTVSLNGTYTARIYVPEGYIFRCPLGVTYTLTGAGTDKILTIKNITNDVRCDIVE